MNNPNLILSIDVGTQSIRAVLFNLSGEIVALEKTEIDPYFSEKPGWAEQNPEYFWEELAKTTQQLLHDSEFISSIKAVTLTTQRGTLINLDKNAKPLRPAMIWLDQRQANAIHFPKGITKMGLSIMKLREAVVHAVKNAECNWIMQNEPDVWEKTDKFLFTIY